MPNCCIHSALADDCLMVDSEAVTKYSHRCRMQLDETMKQPSEWRYNKSLNIENTSLFDRLVRKSRRITSFYIFSPHQNQSDATARTFADDPSNALLANDPFLYSDEPSAIIANGRHFCITRYGS